MHKNVLFCFTLLFAFVGNLLVGKTAAASPPLSIELATVPLYENRPTGTLVGLLSSTSDISNDVFTYTLPDGMADNSYFTVTGNGIYTKESLDYEAKKLYTLRVVSTNQLGNKDENFEIQLLDVNEAPTLNPIAHQSLCPSEDEQAINLTATAGPEGTLQTTSLSVSSNNSALFQDLGIVGNQLRYTIINGQTGTATVTIKVKDNGGTANGGIDEASQSFTVTAYPLPIVTIISDKGSSISRGDSVFLTASGGDFYEWSTRGIPTGQTGPKFADLRPLSNTTYLVKVTKNDCVSEATYTVYSKDDYRTIAAENFVTPNGDGVNDTWVVKNIDAYPAHTLTIIDRAGRVIFKTKDYQNNWGGTLEGSPLNEGTYYYVFQFDQPDIGAMKGFITIVR